MKTKREGYQAEINYGEGWRPIGSKHTIRIFVEENIESPGGFRDQAVNIHGLDPSQIEFRVTTIEFT